MDLGRNIKSGGGEDFIITTIVSTFKPITRKRLNNKPNMGLSYRNASGYNNLSLKLPIPPYPVICLGKNPCVTCHNECRNVKKLKWSKGGQACFVNCKEAYNKRMAEEASLTGGTFTEETMVAEIPAMGGGSGNTSPSSPNYKGGGSSMGKIIGYSAIGLAVLVGGFIVVKAIKNRKAGN
jgi:hypothetical protein